MLYCATILSRKVHLILIWFALAGVDGMWPIALSQQSVQSVERKMCTKIDSFPDPYLEIGIIYRGRTNTNARQYP